LTLILQVIAIFIDIVGITSGLKKNLNKFISISTASPSKFPETLNKVLNKDIELNDNIKILFEKKTSFQKMLKNQNWDDILTEKINSLN
jgi:hypothetical protein